MNKIVVLLLFLSTVMLYSQTKQELQRAKDNQDLLSNANTDLAAGDFSEAEAKYRKVIADDPKNTEARYNLGVAYYNKDKNTEAGRRFVQAAEIATTKEQKHKVYHNLGNALMKDKNYRGAVEAYKNALRNNPKDDETRYNLALAKLMLEEQGDEGGGEEENEEEKEEKEDGENEEEDEGGGDSGEDEDKGDEGEEEDQRSGNEEPEQGDSDEQEQEGQPQQAEGQLSPQQIQSLLEAMNNEERKVQDKIQADKQKGAKTKSEKDW